MLMQNFGVTNKESIRVCNGISGVVSAAGGGEENSTYMSLTVKLCT